MVFLKMRNEESHEPQSHGTLQDGAAGLLVTSRGDNLIHSHATLLRFCCQWSKAYFSQPMVKILYGFFCVMLISSCLFSKLNSSQEPQKPVPYLEKEVVYENKGAGNSLAGTLTYPRSGKKLPAVILIGGRGPTDRDETSCGHRPFLVLADYLSRHGLAVLRSDKRGVGKSDGEYNFLTTRKKDIAADVTAAFQYLQNLPEIDPHRIGLIGHSEGAVVAAMVAAERPEVSFVVMLAGPGLNGGENLSLQLGRVANSFGVYGETIEKCKVILARTIEILKHEEKIDAARAKIIKMYEECASKISEKERGAMKDIGYDFPSDPKAFADGMLSPGFYDFLMYEPKIILGQVKCPVLALNGKKDLQVPSHENLSAIERALKEGTNKDYVIHEIPGLNHLFQSARTGSPTEYEQIEETMSPVALEIIKEWITKHLK